MRMLLLSALLATAIGCDTETLPIPPPFAGITEDGRIAIEEPALGRPLVLTRTYATSTNIEKTNPMRTLLVYFERVDGSSIAMKELRDGTTTPGGSDRTLATFPARVSGNTVTFDFNEGMRKVYLEFSVYEWWEQPGEAIFDIAKGTIRGIRMLDGALVIDRNETVNVPGTGALDARLKYALAEYKPSQAFEPRQNNKVNGFYVNAPVPRGDKMISFAHRHDINQPIVYFVSPEMPAERRADIEAAVRYWNSIFALIGKPGLIQLDTLPAGVQPFDPGRHVITWSPNPLDGAGRALNTTDPLTGQILKSTVFVTSIFELQGKETASTRWMMSQLDAGEAPTSIPNTVLARAVSDYYINTFVHELGHSLGLRHNFAGNLTSTVDAKGYMTPFVTYLRSDLPAGASPSSSVMEYVETPLAILIGAHIRLGREPLPFDVQAVRSMYGSGEVSLGLFCEQELAPVFADCVEFDQGSNPIVGTHAQWENTLDERAFALARAVAMGVPLDSPDLDPQIEAMIIADPLKKLARLLSADAELLAVLSRFPEELTEAQHAEYRRAVLDYQKRGFAELSGPRAVFVQHLVAKRLDAQRVTELTGTLRSRMEGYLAAVGASADPAAMDAWFSALARKLQAEVTPLNEIQYACFSC